MNPLRIPRAVDLPAPLGPTRPCTSPGLTVKEASATAWTPLYCLEIAWTASSSLMAGSFRRARPGLAQALHDPPDDVLGASGDADAQAPGPHHQDEQQDQLEGQRGVLADRRRLDGDDGHDGRPHQRPRRGPDAADEQHREDEDADVAVEVVR